MFNVGHASLLVLGLAEGDWDLVARGLHDRLHQPRRAHLYPESLDLVERAQELGALGATISGAGPAVLVWTHYEQTGGVVEALRRGPTLDAEIRASRSSRRGRRCGSSRPRRAAGLAGVSARAQLAPGRRARGGRASSSASAR